MNLFELAAVLTLDRSGYDSGLDDAENKANSFGSKLKSGLGTAAKVGAAAIGAASTAVVAFGKSSVDAGMTFDSSMSQVAATMGTTVDEIQNLRDFAQEMGSKTAFSASQAADALNYMALAGYDAETSMSMLPNVLNLAAAGGIDLAYASDMITDSQSALGLTLDETSELVDKMAKASSKSNTSVAQLGEAILTVGGTAKTLAGGTTELSTALGILADNGVKGAEGGTALRNIILSLSAPTDKAAGALKNLGVEVFDAEGNMRPLNETFGDLNAALSSMTQGEQTQVLNTIFNKVDLKSVNALLANTIGSFENIEGAIQDTGVQWEKYEVSAEAALQNAAYMLESLGLSAEEAQKQLSLEMNIDAADALATVNAAWKALDEGTITSMTRFDELSGYIDDAAGAAQAMADTQLDNLAGDITLFQSALEGAQIVVSDQLTPTLREFVQFGAQGISEVTEAFKEGGLSSAMEAFGGVLSDGIAMITDMLPTVIEAGISLLDAFVDGILDNADIIAQAAMDIVLKLLNGLGKVLPKLVKAGLDIIKTLAKGISKNIKTVVETIVDVVLTIAEELTNPETLLELLDAGLQIILGLVDGLIAAIPKIIEALPIIIQNIVDTLLGAIPMIIRAGIELFVALVEALPDIITAIVAAIPKIITGIVTAVTQAIPQIIQAGIELFISLVKALPEIITAVVAAIPQIIEGLVTALIESVPQMIEAGITLFLSLIEALPEIIAALIEAVPQIIQAFKEAFGLEGKSFSEIGQNMIMGIWDGIKNMSEWLKEKVGGFFGDIVGTVKDTLGIHSPSKVFAEIGEYSAQGVGIGFDDEFAAIKRDINNQLDFTATANVGVNRTDYTDGYSDYTSSASGASAYIAEKQPLVIILQLPSGVEVGRQYIEDINLAKRVDGQIY